MALQINKLTGYNVNATYFKIVMMNMNWLRKSAEVILSGWIDQVSRNADKAPILQTTFTFSGNDFTFDFNGTFNGDIITEAYNKIKALDDWKNAKDV